MNDPVKMLIDAGAIPTSPFGPSSRYANVAIARHGAGPDDPGVPYVLRRFVPQARDIPLLTRHTVQAGDRVDLLAHQYLGEVELTWRLADANLASDLLHVTESAGARIAIPLPPGATGG